LRALVLSLLEENYLSKEVWIEVNSMHSERERIRESEAMTTMVENRRTFSRSSFDPVLLTNLYLSIVFYSIGTNLLNSQAVAIKFVS